MLEDEAKRDPAKYNQWFASFQNYLKAGAQMDPENREAIFKLLRFNATFTDNENDMVSLDDYIDKMVKG